MPEQSHALTALSSIEGLKRTQILALESAGFGSVEEILAAWTPGAPRISSALGDMSETEVVDRLLPQASFSMLGDVGSRGASVLVESGITSYLALMASAPARVASLLSDLAEPPDARQCADLQLAAAKALMTFRALLRISTTKGQTTAQVTVAGVGMDDSGRPSTAATDKTGQVLTSPLRRDVRHLLAINVQRSVRSISVESRSGAPIELVRVRFDKRPKPPSRPQPGDPPLLLGGSETIVSRPVASTKRLKSGTTLLVSEPMEDGNVVLTSALRQYSGGLVFVDEVRVSAADLPRGASSGDVIEVAAEGGLKRLGARQAKKVMSSRRFELKGRGH